MANIKISKKLFEKEIGKLDQAMQQKIALFGTTLEGFDDDEIELEIFPNRPDLLSYQGFKRSFLAFLGKKKGLKLYKINKPEKNYIVKIEKSVQEVRPYTVCAIVKKIKFNEEKIKEIIDIQEKLHNTIGRKRKKLAIGIYPLEKITLPISFKALEPDKIKFQPLESPREMSGLEILQRHPTGREYAHLLAGKSKFPIFIDSKNQVLSMPPIINSEMTGRITEKTREIFIECSGFNLTVLKQCLNIIITTLAEMGGKIYQMKVKLPRGTEITPDLRPQKNKINIANVNKLLGLELKEKELKENLEKMGHRYLGQGDVESPAWRADILHEVDLIEDIAIAYGYENFKPEIPKISTIGEENPKETMKRKISDILIGLNMLEVSNYHLTTKQDLFKKMGIPEKQAQGFIEVEESKTEYNIIRPNLSHYLLKIFSENIDSEYPQKIFEIGRIAHLKNSGEIQEQDRLAIAITPGNYTELKQILEYLSKMLEIEIKIKESLEIPSHLIDGRTGDILLAGETIGTIGEVHPRILKNWKIKMPVAILEINLEGILE